MGYCAQFHQKISDKQKDTFAEAVERAFAEKTPELIIGSVVSEFSQMSPETSADFFLFLAGHGLFRKGYTAYEPYLKALNNRLDGVENEERSAALDRLMGVFSLIELSTHNESREKYRFVWEALYFVHGFAETVRAQIPKNIPKDFLEGFLGGEILHFFAHASVLSPGTPDDKKKGLSRENTDDLQKIKACADILSVDFNQAAQKAIERTTWEMRGMLDFFDHEKWPKSYLDDTRICHKIIREADFEHVERMSDVIGDAGMKESGADFLYQALWALVIAGQGRELSVANYMRQYAKISDCLLETKHTVTEFFSGVAGALLLGDIPKDEQKRIFNHISKKINTPRKKDEWERAREGLSLINKNAMTAVAQFESSMKDRVFLEKNLPKATQKTKTKKLM